ncbi:MAG: hypothetical protein RI905_500 [Pseudomonadota bacterium]|jgi:TRAP-type mannitol/chloroaromatic compound transport system permease small subunit
MKQVLRQAVFFAQGIDHITNLFASLAKWALVLSCLISAMNAFIRYIFDYSSNSWLEIQWYLFAAAVMLGAAQVLRVNEHVRVDIIYGKLSSKARIYIDLLGLLLFLLPAMTYIAYLAWPLFLSMYQSGEMSSNAGGLIRWPAMLMLPTGFFLVTIQGLSEIIKRLAWLAHVYEMDFHYERPLQ